MFLEVSGTQVRAILAREDLVCGKVKAAAFVFVCVCMSVNGSHKHLSSRVLLSSEKITQILGEMRTNTHTQSLIYYSIW